MTIDEMKAKARWVRQQTVNMTVAAGLGHIAPAFSCTEILVALYYGGILNIRPSEPDWALRDRFILSKGQACAALYAILADKGYFPIAETLTHCQEGSRLGGHSESNVPGVECYTGSLGHGLPIAAGMAQAAKMRGEDWKVYCLVGDGELQEGSNWEAVDQAYHLGLDNLIVIVDNNGQQAIDHTRDVVGSMPLDKKFESFGWTVLPCDGHRFNLIITVGIDGTLKYTQIPRRGIPLAIIAHTVKGQGVPEICGIPIWHYRIPTTPEEKQWFIDALYDDPPSWA